KNGRALPPGFAGRARHFGGLPMSNHEARAAAGSILRHRPLTYRIVKEICNAARELARFPAPFSGVLPDLFVAGDDTHETHSLAPGVATSAGRYGRGRLVGSGWRAAGFCAIDTAAPRRQWQP